MLVQEAQQEQRERIDLLRGVSILLLLPLQMCLTTPVLPTHTKDIKRLPIVFKNLHLSVVGFLCLVKHTFYFTDKKQFEILDASVVCCYHLCMLSEHFQISLILA